MEVKAEIHKRWKGFALDVSFEQFGSCMGILGASGCGKTMTLKAIAGIEKPDSGRIAIGNRILYDSHKKINLPARDRKVGYLFQNYALFPNMTVEENIGAGIRDKEKRQEKVREQIQRQQLLGLEKHYPWQLSGGQQQRAAIARIFAYEPEVILLDEPFSALDSFLKEALQQQLMETLAHYKGAVMIVSHSRDEIYKFCDSLLILSAGRNLIMGKTRELFRNPEKVEAARLIGCKNISPIKRIGKRELYAIDWRAPLKTCRDIGDTIRYVGIRAHSLRPAGNLQPENTLRVTCERISEAPFEISYLLKNAEDGESRCLWWKIGKKDEAAKEHGEEIRYITLPAQSLMLLTE